MCLASRAVAVDVGEKGREKKGRRFQSQFLFTAASRVGCSSVAKAAAMSKALLHVT